jgi:hypothetical protein
MHFLPVQVFLKERELPQKAVLLLDNALRKSVLTKWWPHLCKVFVPSITAITQPTDQEVTASMKQHYQANLLRTFPDKDKSIVALWKKIMVLDAT